MADFTVVAVALFINAILHLAISVYGHNETIATVVASTAIAFDLLLITAFIFINGGIESRGPILYIFPMLMGAAIFGRRAIITIALTSILLYSLVLLFDYFTIIPSAGGVALSLHSNWGYVLNSIVFIGFIIGVIALAINYIANLMHEGERKAYTSMISLQEAQSIARFGSWELDTDTDILQYSSELPILLGAKSNDLIKSSDFLEYIHPDDRQQVRKLIKEARRYPMKVSFSFRTFHGDTDRYLQAETRSFSGEDGRVVKIIGTTRDITAQKELDEAQRDFSIIASHQLRTPATAVKQFIGMLLDGIGGATSETQRQYLQKAYDSNERQLQIINELLNIAQLETGGIVLNQTKTDLVKFLEEIIAENTTEFKTKNQKLSLTSQHKSLMLDIDSSYLKMAIENLLDNAHKYSPEGGKVVVKLRNNHQKISIDIVDNGIGVPKDSMDKIFKKFGRADNAMTSAVNGTGLGLYWTRKVVKLHGGDIAVHSKINEGTTFTIMLPRSK